MKVREVQIRKYDYKKETLFYIFIEGLGYIEINREKAKEAINMAKYKESIRYEDLELSTREYKII
ncbi:hypothetical protein PL373_19800 [Tenacibaculum maritimum]|nr:hypothetical protein [Tenacibaculum maritimum]MDB0599705.1 hypothetical protein [Tenacibaculum maritimum]MDB0599878.1 hypothetical protein [Tenacibaculum maritimum]MDB0601760.1 hypothetical protein [Tenacibaculum maritimum]MDB0602293.1 hypothetical protein [Tenacibaculum maritimum]MDB0603332.1 hypothetical protein [Tenacibaculum maritimum]